MSTTARAPRTAPSKMKAAEPYNALKKTFKNQSHRVAKMRSPLVVASQTVHAGNLALLDEEFSFVTPVSSELGWRIKKAVRDLVHKYGTGDATTLYERNGVYVFDAWIKPGPGEKKETNVAKPREKVSERSLAASRGPGSPELVSERSLADSGVRISSDKVEERTYEVPESE